jgi:hypothetical protein
MRVQLSLSRRPKPIISLPDPDRIHTCVKIIKGHLVKNFTSILDNKLAISAKWLFFYTTDISYYINPSWMCEQSFGLIGQTAAGQPRPNH